MEERQKLAARYREKGRNARALALLMPEGEARTIQMQRADHYEKLAAFAIVGAASLYYTGLERRCNFQLRADIAEYEWQATLARKQAEEAVDPELRDKLLAQANLLTEMADSLKGRGSESTYSASVEAPDKDRSRSFAV